MEEQEMLWKREPTDRRVFPLLFRVLLNWHSDKKTLKKGKRKQHDNFDHQKVNYICSRNHCVNSS